MTITMNPLPKIEPPENALVIGLAGLKRSGKDEALKAASRWGQDVHPFAWSWPLKLLVHQQFGISWKDLDGLGDLDREASLPQLNGKSIRELLIEVGEAFRNFDPEFWVRRAQSYILDQLPAVPHPLRVPVVVISGTRFTHEARMCHEVWWVERPRLWWECSTTGRVWDEFEVVSWPKERNLPEGREHAPKYVLHPSRMTMAWEGTIEGNGDPETTWATSPEGNKLQLVSVPSSMDITETSLTQASCRRTLYNDGQPGHLHWQVIRHLHQARAQFLNDRGANFKRFMDLGEPPPAINGLRRMSKSGLLTQIAFE